MLLQNPLYPRLKVTQDLHWDAITAALSVQHPVSTSSPPMCTKLSGKSVLISPTMESTRLKKPQHGALGPSGAARMPLLARRQRKVASRGMASAVLELCTLGDQSRSPTPVAHGKYSRLEVVVVHPLSPLQKELDPQFNSKILVRFSV